jgi:hypothetical protein
VEGLRSCGTHDGAGTASIHSASSDGTVSPGPGSSSPVQRAGTTPRWRGDSGKGQSSCGAAQLARARETRESYVRSVFTSTNPASVGPSAGACRACGVVWSRGARDEGEPSFWGGSTESFRDARLSLRRLPPSFSFSTPAGTS